MRINVVSKSLVSLLIASVLMLSLLPGLTCLTASAVPESGMCGTDLTWEFDDSTGIVTITGPGDMYDYGMDGDIDENPWIGMNVKEVIIGDEVTRIGNYAFNGLGILESVHIGNSVESIGYYSFAGTGVESLRIPASVSKIEDGTHLEYASGNAFYGCESISYIEVDNENVTYCAVDGVLFSKSKDELICYPAGKTDSFYSVPDGVTTIVPTAFSMNADLKEIEMPDGITRIGNYAFYATGYYMDESNWTDGVLYIGEYLIQANETLSGTYTVKPGTKCIAGGAFGECELLTRVEIPEGVKRIDSGLFWGCKELKEIKVPGSVNSVAISAFVDCKKLSDIYFEGPESQWNSSIKNDGFSDTNQLEVNKTKIHFKNDHLGTDNKVYYSSETGVTLYEDGSIMLPSGDKVENAIILKPKDGNSRYEISINVLNPQNNGGFSDIVFGCLLEFELDIINGNPVSKDNPAEFLVSKDAVGRDKDKIAIVHIAKGGLRESFAFSKNDSAFQIEEGGPGYENYWKITVTSLSPFAIYEIPSVSIKSNPGIKMIDYGQILRLEAGATKGYEIHWFIGSKDTGKTGTVFEYDAKNGDAEIKAVLYKDGKAVNNPVIEANEISDTETVKVSSGFLKKLIAFFRYTLFKADRVVKN